MADSPELFTEFLKRVKQRRFIPLPDEPETLCEALERVSRPGCAAEIRRAVYFELLKRAKPAVRLIYHFFLVGEDGSVRLFWFDPESRRNFACTLTKDQAVEFAHLFQVRELLLASGRPELGTHGYGPFLLEDLLPSESFVDWHQREGRVCNEQPGANGLVAVWMDPNGGSTFKLLLPGSNLVYVPQREQARRVTRRAAERRRRAEQRRRRKGA